MFNMNYVISRPLQIYELADVAAILGIAKSRVKNWTIGRPFSLRPSVRASFGKGSRNLFGENDLYCFALIQRLSDVGAPVAAIQSILDKQWDLARDAFWEDQNWVVIKRQGHHSSYEVNIAPESTFNVPLEPEDEVFCFYAVNLKSIVDTVSKKINMFRHRQTTPVRPRVKEGAKQKRL